MQKGKRRQARKKSERMQTNTERWKKDDMGKREGNPKEDMANLYGRQMEDGGDTDKKQNRVRS